MKRVLLFATLLVLISPIAFANAAEMTVPQSITSLKVTPQESNFYNLNIDTFVIPEAKTLITAVSGNKIFIGDRPSRTLTIANITGNTLTLSSKVTVPTPSEIGHPSNALLDMIATKDHLYLAVVDGGKDFPACGAAKIYDYLIAKLDAKPTLLFKSSPCVQGELFWDARLALNGNELFIAGGNSLTKYDDGTFPGPDSQNYVDGMDFPKTNYFGAVSSINIKTKKVTLIATGLRHLGGLLWDSERKTLWESENGPRGGDELNIILKGKNYGWPQVTLGRPYDFETPEKGRVKINTIGSSQPPTYGWTPSISPSTIRKVPSKGEFAKYWAGDLIVGSLKGNQLRRLRISPTNTVMYDEPIPVGDRIRTLDFLSDGRLILATDTGRIMLVSDSEALGTGRYPKDPPAAA